VRAKLDLLAWRASKANEGVLPAPCGAGAVGPVRRAAQP